MSHEATSISDVIAHYLQALDAGQTVDRAELLTRHPAWAAELQQFFATQDAVEKLAQPLRQAVPGPAPEMTLDSPDKAQANATNDLGSIRYFGDYELLSEIARGGMGVVFKARQVSVNRLVAVKMILAGQLATTADIQRFRSEAETAANLDHPHIVPIYEVGEHEGQHYFSMKLIEGPTIADCGLRIADWQERQRWIAQLIATVARAVHHAHQRGVLHRDLKPSNILLDAVAESAIRHPQSAIPMVTDFGLAKRLTTEGGVTQTGAIVGTPEYMAPEQALGRKDLTTAADVYSLGAVLYALLTGQPPFRGDTVLETLKLAAEKEPASPQSLNPKVDRDLATVCLKCLEKDPARRYSSASELADDLRRWRDGEPIQARPAGRIERLRKWAHRKPAAAAALLIAGTALLSIATLVVVLWQQSDERANAEANLNEELRQRGIQLKNERDRAVAQSAQLAQQLLVSRSNAMTAQLVRVQGLWQSQPDRGRALLDDTRFCPPELRDFTWRLYKQLCQPPRQALSGTQMPREFHAAAHMRYGVFGAGLLTRQIKERSPTDGGGTLDCLMRWHVLSGAPIATIPIAPGNDIIPVALDARGNRMAVATAGALTVWDISTNEKKMLATLDMDGDAPVLSPDGSYLATSPLDGGSVTLWQVQPWQKLRTHKLGKRGYAQFAPDGKTVALVSDTASIKTTVWDIGADKKLAELTEVDRVLGFMTFPKDTNNVFLHYKTICYVQPVGQPRITGFLQTRDFEFVMLDLLTGKERGRIRYPHSTTAESLAVYGPYGGEGALFMVNTLDDAGHLQVWSVPEGVVRARFKPTPPEPNSPLGAYTGDRGTFALSPNGQKLAALQVVQYQKVGQQPYATLEIRVFDVSHGQDVLRFTFLDKGFTATQRIEFAPDGQHLLTFTASGLNLWDIIRTHESSRPRLPSAHCFAFLLDSKRLAVGQEQGVTLWDLQARAPASSLPNAGWTTRLVAAADGTLLIGGPDANILSRWDGKAVKVLLKTRESLGPFQVSPDGKLLVWQAEHPQAGNIHVHDAATGEEIEHLTLKAAGEGHQLLLGIAPDGEHLAVARNRQHFSEVGIWHIAQKRWVRVLQGARGTILCGGFSPDGRWLVAAGEDSLVRVWEVAAGKLVHGLAGHRWPIRSVAFSPDSCTLATADSWFAGDDPEVFAKLAGAQEVRLWDVLGGQTRVQMPWPGKRGTDGVRQLAFSPDGQLLAAVGPAQHLFTGAMNRLLLWSAVPTAETPNETDR